MEILQNRKAARVSYCGGGRCHSGRLLTSRQQPPAANANTNVAAAPEAAQPTAQEAKARPAGTRAAPSPEATSKKTSRDDPAQIHQANLKEIAIGKLAQEKASTSEVRAYADQLVQDHTNADQMVVAIARRPARICTKSAHAKLADKKLSSAGGAAFDRLFLQQTGADQEDSSARCNRSAKMPATMTSRRLSTRSCRSSSSTWISHKSS